MGRRIAALIFIFFCTSIAWIILGGVTNIRTYDQDVKLKRSVGQLWGTVQKQEAPRLYYLRSGKKSRRAKKSQMKTQATTQSLPLNGSDIKVNFKLDYRKKGLLWYSTYQVDLCGKYTVKNDSKEKRDIFFEYSFPSRTGIYDNFCVFVDGEKVEKLEPYGGKVVKEISFKPNETKIIEVSYSSQGMNEWWYLFGADVSQIENFKLTMTTDFDEIDFPANTISATKKVKKGDGWELTWQYVNLISGIQIGMDMPQKLNPGPFISRLSFFAPVSLFLFLFLMFIITTVKKIKIHPMNYFFVSAAFFSFHLLLAYLADHINIHAACLISSAVSIFLVISYMRLVVGMRFAFVETGLSQFVYLVLFSYAFFLEGYTGLAITISCILTLFVVMQFTGRIDWDKQFSR